MMDWSQLLGKARFGSSRRSASPRPQADTRNEFERDGGRILYSSSFRRLQDKTQVFPIGRNDDVRTRLTHSLEVQNVGRELGLRVGSVLGRRAGHGLAGIGDAPGILAAIVSAACLAHDIGNPPFGHSGEEALTHALERHGIRCPLEGNAQGFRVLTRIGDPMQGRGLKLTAAVLGAFMKYPCSQEAWQARRDGKAAPRLENKKFGYIDADREAAEWVMEETGMARLGEGLALRHPLAYLMEAADDLSYLIADVEDAYISRLISFDAARDALLSLMTAGTRQRMQQWGQVADSHPEHIRLLRAMAVGSCIEAAAASFIEHEQDILGGRMQHSLMKASELGEAYGALSRFSAENIYAAPQIVGIEVMGYRVLGSLVELFLEWVHDPQGSLGRKLGLMLGEGCKLPAPPPGAGEEARLRHMLDVLCSMTDSSALATYRALNGIR